MGARAMAAGRGRAGPGVLAAAGLLALAGVFGSTAGAGCGGAKAPADASAAKRPAWSKEVVRLFASLPIQDRGRVKPFSTYVGFQLLRTRGARTYTTTLGERLGPTEWALDCLFYPDFAIEQRVFRVENDEVLDAVGLAHEGKRKRDYYSYKDLRPARDRIIQKTTEYGHVDEKQRSPVQHQTVLLGQNLAEFERLLRALDFARHSYAVDASPALAEVFGGRTKVSHVDVLDRGVAFYGAAVKLRQQGREQEIAPFSVLFERLAEHTHAAGNLALVPAPGTAKESPAWLSPSEVAEASVSPAGAELAQQRGVMRGFEEVIAALDRPADLERAAGALHDRVRALAEARGEYAKIPLEVAFYRGDFFYKSLILFLLGFVLSAGTWLVPTSRWLARLAPFPTILAIGLVTVGIVLRCVIRSRPPVSTLYETIIFITAVAALVAVATRYLARAPIALGVASLLGALGMFLANKYEMNDAQTQGDTMPTLVAVLDTNFWLATHVTTVTIGYAAGLLAGAVAHIHLLGRMLGIKRDDGAFYRSVARMVYGIIAFGLVFSVIGTILGGIWANDSWGRFWGWDPKENGALLICLWELMIIHARLGGYIRDFGVCMAAVFGGMVVATSWWGVNLLEIGLHSYGFTRGAALGLKVFFGIEALVMLAAGLHWLLAAGPRGGQPPRLGDPALDRLT